MIHCVFRNRWHLRCRLGGSLRCRDLYRGPIEPWPPLRTGGIDPWTIPKTKLTVKDLNLGDWFIYLKATRMYLLYEYAYTCVYIYIYTHYMNISVNITKLCQSCIFLHLLMTHRALTYLSASKLPKAPRLHFGFLGLPAPPSPYQGGPKEVGLGRCTIYKLCIFKKIHKITHIHLYSR